MSVVVNDWDFTQNTQSSIVVPVVPAGARVGDGNTSPSPTRANPNKRWCFTYNNPDLGFMDILMNHYRVLKYVFQLEVGESGTEHFQGVIEFDCKVRPKSVFGEKWNAIHWESCKNWDASVIYCQKQQGRKRGPWLKGVSKTEEIKILKFNELRPWQTNIINLIEQEPNDRQIHWFWESTGGFGKSTFTKFLCARYDAMLLTGKATDMKYAIMQKGSFPRIAIIDCPRSMQEYLSYPGIEEIKNGMFFCGKYESKQILGNSPHIIVFANFEPDYSKLSNDRWIITQLE